MALAGNGRPRGRPEGNAVVSDIFHEVDEEVRREQLKKLWERYGNLLIAACVLVVLATAGWRTHEMTAWREASGMMLADPETPAGARGQVQMLMALSDADKKS